MNYLQEDRTPLQQDFFDRIKYFPSEENIKNNFTHFLDISFEILHFMETRPINTKGVRLFSLLPLKSGFSTDHLHLSNSSLQQCLSYIQKKDDGNIISILGSNDLLTKQRFDENANEIWRSIFNISKLETSKRKFASHISTNGCSVSVHLEISITEDMETKEIGTGKNHRSLEYDIHGSENDFTQVVAIDPGHANLYYACLTNKENDSSKIRSLHCSTSQYRHESAMNRQIFWNENLKKRFPEYQRVLQALPSLLTSSADLFLERVIERAVYKNYLFDFHLHHQGFLNHKFRIKSQSEKVLHQQCKKLTSNSKGKSVKTLIGIGDWSRPNGVLKGRPSGPNLKFKRKLERYCSELVLVQEHKTSKLCHKCKHENENPSIVRITHKKNSSLIQTVSVEPCHHVLRCTNNECGTWWNRDHGASLNISEILFCQLRKQPRPICFTRNTV